MKHLLLLLYATFSINATAQDSHERKPFNGMVQDVLGQPMRNVKIWVTNDRQYTMSDRKGRFGLTDVKATDTLHIKYKKQRYDIAVEGRKSMRIMIADEPRVEEDQELVDMGYGFVRRREYTGVSNYISGEELRNTGRGSLLAALQGRVPGLNVVTGPFPSDERVSMRGITSINLDNTPLFLVDGVIVESLDHINIYDVESVEVLKDASIYGARGANGAILVHTRRGGKN